MFLLILNVVFVTGGIGVILYNNVVYVAVVLNDMCAVYLAEAWYT